MDEKEQIEMNSILHPNNSDYVIDIQLLAERLGCSQQHARNVMKTRVDARLLVQENGVTKWFTSEAQIDVYRSSMRPRGRKRIERPTPKKVYKIAISPERLEALNTLLSQHEFPKLIPARK